MEINWKKSMNDIPKWYSDPLINNDQVVNFVAV